MGEGRCREWGVGEGRCREWGVGGVRCIVSGEWEGLDAL